MTAAILADRRRVPPYGLVGRIAGRARAQLGASAPTARASNSAGLTVVEVGAGDVFVIETPGGGGYGKA